MSEHASTHSTERLDIRPWSMAKVALPVSLGIFVQFIVVVIDNYFVAQLDGNAMSAVAFVGLIYITLAMLGVGLGNATQILIARRKGQGDYASYLKFMKTQLTELLTNYGEISNIWFDGHWDQTNPEGTRIAALELIGNTMRFMD